MCHYWICTWEFQVWVFHCWRCVTNLSFEGNNFGLLFQHKWIYSGIFRAVDPTSSEHVSQIHKQQTRPLSMEPIKQGSCLHSPNQSLILFPLPYFMWQHSWRVSSGCCCQTLIFYSSLILLLESPTSLWGFNSRDSYCAKRAAHRRKDKQCQQNRGFLFKKQQRPGGDGEEQMDPESRNESTVGSL